MISFSLSSGLLPIKIYFVAVLLPILPIEMASNRSTVGYESLWNLNEMAECKLHYTALDYNNYGCWCGVGGSGEPMDGIDDCCMHHDKCYDAAVDNGICFDTEIEYVDNYDWACTDGEPVCPPSLAGCKSALCLCDKNVVDCWSKYPKPNDKAKCTHCNGGFLDRILAVMQSIGAFFASIPKAIANLFS